MLAADGEPGSRRDASCPPLTSGEHRRPCQWSAGTSSSEDPHARPLALPSIQSDAPGEVEMRAQFPESDAPRD